MAIARVCPTGNVAQPLEIVSSGRFAPLRTNSTRSVGLYGAVRSFGSAPIC